MLGRLGVSGSGIVGHGEISCISTTSPVAVGLTSLGELKVWAAAPHEDQVRLWMGEASSFRDTAGNGMPEWPRMAPTQPEEVGHELVEVDHHRIRRGAIETVPVDREARKVLIVAPGFEFKEFLAHEQHWDARSSGCRSQRVTGFERTSCVGRSSRQAWRCEAGSGTDRRRGRHRPPPMQFSA